MKIPLTFLSAVILLNIVSCIGPLADPTPNIDATRWAQAAAEESARVKEANAVFSRGDAYQNMDEHQKAIMEYTKAIELWPNHTGAYMNRCLSYQELEKYQAAIQDCDKAIQLDPNDSSSYNNRGAAYHNWGQYQRAIHNYTSAIQLNPNYAMAYNNRGSAYQEMGGEFFKARADKAKACSLDSKYC